MTGYDYHRAWFDFAFENQERVSPAHGVIYLWNVELNNRMGWVKHFASPASQAMAAAGIKSYNTYKKVFSDLVEWGFIEVIRESKNQYTACIIALSNFDKALDKALDKAITTHTTKQQQSTVQSTDSIIKQTNQQTNKPTNQETYSVAENGDSEILEDGDEKNPSSEKKKRKKETPPSSAPPPSEEKPPNLPHRIRKEVEARKPPGLWWDKREYAQAKEIGIKIAHRMKAQPGWPNDHEPTDDQIVENFCLLVDNLKLTGFWNDKWDIINLNSRFQVIADQVEEKLKNNNGHEQPHKAGYSPPDSGDRWNRVKELIAQGHGLHQPN